MSTPAERAPSTYDYAVIRVVPRVERGEFVNAGVILACQDASFLDARIELDATRVLALDPAADLATIAEHLAAIPAICAGGKRAGALGALSRRERFDWLTAPRSALIQTSPVHTGRCSDAVAALDALMRKMVRTNAAAR
ncbi:MAG: DUF3037 domain-containing protein [Rudaea sp.]|uniref:DUF3037 domain-containing protein n=1 Tax=unclassified Rudaea TaxID=2627037 RepID=UPI0010F64F20|nr:MULTISPECIES: DUF3037 domain-containing protein [unclassified Rudaea]MBN8887018.1 DUF3037 domain-containing protein [Rudaea sp.]